MFYPDTRHPDEQRFERWLNEARAEATKLTAQNLPAVFAVETGLWGVRVMGRYGAHWRRATVHWAHVKARTGSPFAEAVRLVAQGLGVIPK